MIETPKGYTHEINGQELIFQEIRGAIIGPNVGQVGYYCIFGKTLDGRLMFLTEGEDRSQDVLFKKLFNDAEDLVCHMIYIDQRQDGFVYSIAKFMRDNSPGLSIKLSHSAFINDVGHGASLLGDRAALNELDFPHGTKIHTQFGTLSPKTIDDTYYAIYALFMLLGGFWTHKGDQYVSDFKERQRKQKRDAALKKLDRTSRAASIEIEKAWEEAAEMSEYLGDMSI